MVVKTLFMVEILRVGGRDSTEYWDKAEGAVGGLNQVIL
jgi:hypothetical protein